MVYVSLMRLIVVNYWSYVNNPIPDQAKRVIYVEKIQLEWMRFPLTIRIPNESRTAGISSPDEPRIVLTLKTDSLSRYGPRETLPSPIRPSGAAANLQGTGLPTRSAVRLHKCCTSVQLSSACFLWKTCVCPLFPTSVPLVAVGSWHEVAQLLFSGPICEWHFVYFLLAKQVWSLVLFPLPLKWLWGCYWAEISAAFYRIDVCIEK